MTTVMSFDPGGTTGWAYWQHNWDTFRMEVGQLGPKHHHLALYDMVEEYDPQIIVCENFTYQRRDPTKGIHLELISVQYIGVLSMYQQKHPETLLVFQMPNVGKSIWTDDKLKAVDHYHPGLKHANDAVRHLIHYLSEVRGMREWYDKLKPGS